MIPSENELLTAESGKTAEMRQTLNKITEVIIGAAIAVHKELGPGLLESAYEACLVYELAERGLKVQRQKGLPITYRGVYSGCKVGLLINFNVRVLKNGIRRLVHEF